MFGQYSGEDGDFVRSNILELIKLDKDFYQSVGHTVLNIRGTNIDEWLVDMEDPNMFPDELMLYALSRVYNRHTVVVCRDRNWSAVTTTHPINEDDLFNICQLHLIYLGCSVFACLRHKPFTSNITANPITMEQMTAALMQVRGKGRQRKPLNLTTPKLDSSPFVVNNQLEGDEDKTTDTEPPTLFVPILLLNVDSLNQDGASELDGALSRYDSQPVFPGMEHATTTTTTNTTRNNDNIPAATAIEPVKPPDCNQIVADNGTVDPEPEIPEESKDSQAQVGDDVLPVQSVWDVATRLHYCNYDQISGELAELKSSLPTLPVLKDVNNAIKGQNSDSDDIELNLEKECLPTPENVKGDNEVPTLEEITKGGNVSI